MATDIEHNYMLNKYFDKKNLYTHADITNIGKCYIKITLFQIKEQFCILHQNFMLIVVYPFNHKIKKYKSIIMESDLNYLKNFRREYS